MQKPFQISKLCLQLFGNLFKEICKTMKHLRKPTLTSIFFFSSIYKISLFMLLVLYFYIKTTSSLVTLTGITKTHGPSPQPRTSSGQSYKQFMIVIYESGVVIWAIF